MSKKIFKIGQRVNIVHFQNFADHTKVKNHTSSSEREAIVSGISPSVVHVEMVRWPTVGKKMELYFHYAMRPSPGKCLAIVTPQKVTQITPVPVEKEKPLLLKKRTPQVLGQHEILGQKKIQEQLEVAANLDIPVLLVGDTGTGKTTIVKEVAERHKRQWIRFNLTGETTVDEFVGKYVLENKQTVWEDGVLLTAMKTGKWIVVDEVNVALPEILFVLHSLLDDDRSVMVSNHNGEVVKPHKNFRFFGTMNPVDEYAGTKELNKAFKSRFGMILNMEYPKPQIETEIVEGKGHVPYEVATQIVDVAVKIRQAKEKSQVFYTCSTRDIIQWAALTGKLGFVDAFEVTLLNKANGDRDQLVKILHDVTGHHLSTRKEGYILNIDYLIDHNIQLHEARKAYDHHRAATEERIKEELLTKLMKKDKAKVEPVTDV